ncbi:NAD-dependent glutamate dehydrogenase [Microsporum canis]|uniref:NAD-specific glutamate dehydrogenase n=1 Tax=Arthroderma otae (strain ATCC MYA-4605 / CBS 113480) TaxID=554155 RepID=C5FNT6_ARTOC|nr:NAD-specific glutamate dehydrogenase [Microsporum canis CBS 113480]EEQ31789.1 NAD-specific glutamate dehydrogenase [Microsporum canis CBS 113480]
MSDSPQNGGLPARPKPASDNSGSGTPTGFQRPLNKQLDNVVRTPGRQPSPQPTHLGIPGGTHRVLAEQGPGYVAAKFEGKEAQMLAVSEQLENNGFIPYEFVASETNWFYNLLGIDDMYFQTETVEAITSHILSLYAAKVAAYARDDKRLEIRLDKEAEDHAVYIDTSRPGVTTTDGPRYEQRIDEKYINGATPADSFRVETFRSSSPLPDNSEQQLRCYFVYKCQFGNPNPGPEETNIEVVGDKLFLQKATDNTKAIYQELLINAVARSGPVIEMFEIEGSREKRLVIAYRQGSAMGFFSALSDLYHYYRLTSSRKYLENFSNGITIVSLYLRPTPGYETSQRHPPIEAAVHQILKEISLLYCIPQNKFQGHFISGRLSLQETIYAHCVWVFVQQFLNRLGSEYTSLAAILDSSNSAHAELLSKLKKRLRSETFTSDYILEIIQKYPDLIHRLYLNFANTHYVQTRGEAEDDFLPTLSYLRLQVDEVLNAEQLKELVSKTVVSENDRMVMQSFLTFNAAVLKTNFYTPTKVALSFRLSADFLPKHEYPDPLYGMFIIISSEFRGFHLRFRDIARGGIRIVKSRDNEAYAINARSLFDENYNLANTQQRKNKDIPEGGAKGVLLLDVNHQDKVAVAFHKYIDSILDLLLPPASPGIKDPIVDLHGQDEILFMGPDENSAPLVDWATEHARKRGAPWWKSFFTGKSPKLGGIPHDRFAMTTLSVRENVEGIYRKMGIDETKVRLFQTGGPDGDLGSNGILLGKEQYVAIVDGSGVLADPNGLDRPELTRLARSRKMICEYDISKLSKDGYRVLCDDSNVTLPSGEVVNNGTAFRNTYHLRPEKYDIFVPCGGRPESINLNNVSSLIVDGKSIVPYIVEGANLFVTQDSKIRLEKAGCVIYKDASSNKGGVTSSSLEVLASLSFDDAGFTEHMCVAKDGTAPPFYDAYVREVQETIKRNARLEFEAIWRENERTGIPRSVLSDTLSVAITQLDEELQNSELWDNIPLRKATLKDALPKLLIEKIGLETLLERIPDNYLRSIFGSYLASRFVYEYGANPSQFAFFDFMGKRMPKEEN